MAWVEEKYIKIKGFPGMLLKHIREACELDQVEWDDKSFTSILNYTHGNFKWKGATFRVTEINESVREVTLMDGTLDDEDLTALVLRG